mgnify:CR=1 FL=1
MAKKINIILAIIGLILILSIFTIIVLDRYETDSQKTVNNYKLTEKSKEKYPDQTGIVKQVTINDKSITVKLTNNKTAIFNSDDLKAATLNPSDKIKYHKYIDYTDSKKTKHELSEVIKQ